MAPTVFVLSLLLSACAFIAVDGVELFVKPLGELFYKPLGGAMVFTCEVKHGDQDYIDDEAKSQTTSSYRLQWYDSSNTEIVDRTGRRYVEEENDIKKLYITDIEPKDEGSYRCSITVNGATTEKTVSLKLFRDITFQSAVTPQHPRIYSDAVIKCVVVGQPEPDISWRYKGHRVVLDTGRYFKAPDGLRISNITLADDGEYTCRAEVEADGRYDERKISVAVHIPPKITDALSNVEGIEGEDVTLSCKATSMPSPTYTYFRDGVAVVNTDRITVDPVAGSIRFKPVLKSDEDIRYNCTASNDVGSDSAVGKLKVLVRPTIQEFKDVKEVELRMAKLVCLAQGDPVPEVTVQRVGHAAPYRLGTNDDTRIRTALHIAGHLILSIDVLEPSDAGEYQCIAISSIGQHNDTATLTVEYKPRFASNHSTVEHIWAGKRRNITCSADAVPEATFEWKRNDRKLQDNDTYHVYNSGGSSILEVTVREMDQAWIYGVYTCAARNSHGNHDINIELKRASVPDEPKSVNVTSRMPNAVIVKIEPPEEDGGMPILGYRVEYNDVSYDISTVTIDGTGPPYDTPSTATDAEGNIIQLDNLKPSTTYVLVIRAKNEVGVGSPRRYEVTTEAIRHPYPLELTSPKDGEHSKNYRIVWNKPNTGGRPIKEYEFRYKQVTYSAAGAVVVVDQTWTSKQREDKFSHPMRDFELDGLKPDSHYLLQVRARNDLGWSEYTNEFVFRTAPATEGEQAALHQSTLGSGAVIGIVLVVVLVVLIVTDVSCYYRNHCGITMTLCRQFCPDKAPHKYNVKEKELEAGEKQRLKANNDDDKDEENQIKLDKMDLNNKDSAAAEKGAIDGVTIQS